MSGSGKSYYCGWLLEQIVPEFGLAIHYDVEDEERGLSDANHEPLYETLAVDQDRFASLDWIQVVYRHRVIRVVPDGLTVDETRELYGRLCAAVMALCKDLRRMDLSKEAFRPDSAFVSCDEAHTVVPEGTPIDERVERLITGGRKHGVECLHVSQRPQLLHKTCITQADKRIYFAVNGERDLKKIDRMANFDAGRLKSLGSRRCIVENKDSGEWIEVDTNEIERARPHYSGDDGIADAALPV
jgi:hypothetical protein